MEVAEEGEVGDGQAGGLKGGLAAGMTGGREAVEEGRRLSGYHSQVWRGRGGC